MVWLKILGILACLSVTNGTIENKAGETEGTLVVQLWPNQVWCPVLLKMLTSVSILFNCRITLLHLPQSPMQVHPIWRKMEIIVAHISGSKRKVHICQKELLKTHHTLGEMGLKSDTTASSKNLLSFVLRGMKMSFRQPLKLESSS